MNKTFVLRTAFALLASLFAAAPDGRGQDSTNAPELWKEPAQPLERRVDDLLARMTQEEKVQQIRNGAPAIPRLGIPAYDYWSEALHGVARHGIATVIPQAIGMAATWVALLFLCVGVVFVLVVCAF